MRIKYLMLICTMLMGSKAWAANLVDSVGVENVNGKKVIIHKVELKETYYAIGRRYNIAPKDIMEYNGNKLLQPSMQIRIPTQQAFIQQKQIAVSNSAQQKESANPAAEQVIEYKVGPRETLYSIAQRFNTTVDAIKKLNNLKSDGLGAGQILKVKFGKPDADRPAVAQNPIPTNFPNTNAELDTGSINASDRLKYPVSRYGLTEMTERGVAVWIADENLDGSKMLALHRSAPIGTVVKITNPMSGKSTFAKVVGKFTENETTKDVIIVVTKATADLLGVLDKRFQANIVYGAPDTTARK